jgi:hypothetical protein
VGGVAEGLFLCLCVSVGVFGGALVGLGCVCMPFFLYFGGGVFVVCVLMSVSLCQSGSQPVSQSVSQPSLSLAHRVVRPARLDAGAAVGAAVAGCWW